MVASEAVLVLIVWGYARYVPVRTAGTGLLTCFCQCDLVISTQTWNAEVDSRTEHRTQEQGAEDIHIKYFCYIFLLIWIGIL